MRTLNVRLTVVLLVLGLVFVVGVYFVHGYQLVRNADVFKREADKYLEDAEAADKAKDTDAAEEAYRKGIQNLSWYVRLKPKEYDSMERLGMLLADRAKDSRSFSQAFSTLESLLRMQPDRQAARRRVVNMAIQAKLYQAAKEHLRDFLVPQTPKDKQSELWQLLGQCNAETGETDLAVENYKQAIELSPKNIEAYAPLATLLRHRLGRTREADELMERLVTANPDSYKAHLSRGVYLKNIEANNDAFREATEALKLAPDDREVLLLAVSCYITQKDIEKARECAARALKLYGDDVEVYIAVSQVELAAGDRAKSIEAVQQGLRATKRQPQLLWRLATLLVDGNQLKEGQQVVEELRGTAWQKPLVDFLAARIEFAQQHWLAARETLERIRGSLGMWPLVQCQADVLIGHCYGKAGNRDQQVEAFRRALKTNPSSAPALAGLVDALMAQGKVDEALYVYSQLSKVGKLTPAMLIPKVQMLIQQNLKRPMAEQNWSDAEKVLDQIQKLDPEAIQVPILRAKILGLQNRTSEAEQLLKNAIAKNPKNDLLRGELAQLSKDPKEIQSILDDWEKHSGDTVEQRLAQAQTVVRLKGSNAGDELRKLSENVDHFSDAQRLQLWSGLVNAAMQGGDLTLARKLCQQIADKEPNSIQVRYMMFDYAMYANDESGMEQALKEIERVNGQDPFWLCGKAIMLTMGSKNAPPDSASLDEALKKLAQAREIRPTWSRLPVVMATIYDRQGNTDKALAEYLNAMEMGERSPGPVRRTIQLLFVKQRYSQADRLLRELEKQQVPFTPEMTRATVEVALQLGDFDRALEKAKTISTSESKDYQEHIWYGDVLNIIGRHLKAQGRTKEGAELLAEAETSFRRAVDLEPTKPGTWISLVRFLMSVDKDDEIEKVMVEAEAKIPKKERALGLAQCYEAMKKNETAQDQYELALAATPNDPATVLAVADFYCRNGNTKPAETLLLRIIGREVASKDSEVASARRQYATILSQRGGYQNLEKARDLIDKNLASPESTTMDIRIKAALDADAPQRERRDEAIHTYEKMVQDQVASESDRFKLAQLYLRVNMQEKAFNILRKLIAASPDNGRYLATYIAALLENNQISTAREQVDRLEKIYPNQFVSVSLRAEALVARDKAPEAFELLKAFVDKPNAQPADRNVRVFAIAQKLEGLAKRLTNRAQTTMADLFLREAESLYRTYVEQNSGTDWVLVAYYARQGRIDEALDLLDRTWDSNSPPVLAQVCSLFIQDGIAGPEQLQRVGRIAKKAVAQFDRPIPLLLVMADIYGRQGHYSDAETIYREVIKKNATNIQAMNNLAVLLALQGVRLDEAVRLINQAIEIAGPLGAILDSRALIYLAKGDLKKAQADMNEALADAESPVRLFHQAQIYDKAGERSHAAATMEKAIKAGLTKQMLQPEEGASFKELSHLPK